MKTFFISATTTDAGKTFFTEKLTQYLIEKKQKVYAIKPFETGVIDQPKDATLLANACQQKELAFDPNFYRAKQPLAPIAINQDIPIQKSIKRINELKKEVDILLVEGAGGLFVPIKKNYFMIDYAKDINASIILVAPNRLGVLSYVISTLKAAENYNVNIETIILNNINKDESSKSNLISLKKIISASIIPFEWNQANKNNLKTVCEKTHIL